MDLTDILSKYNRKKLTIGVLGGHSALDICEGAKRLGFNTVAVCQKGREKTYNQYYKTRGDKGCIDHVIVVDKFADIVKPEVQQELRDLNTIFIHNRYFWVYCNFDEIEKDFQVPIFGTREMLKFEERDIEMNQYWLLEQAGIRIPKMFDSSADIDRLVIVKVNEAERGYERAFFYASDQATYEAEAQKRLDSGLITAEALDGAVIEEFIVGAQINFNYFYSSLTGELELMGTDTRRQTNIDGFLRLPAQEQEQLRKFVEPSLVETGHIAVTIKESLVEKALEAGEKFVAASKEHYAPGIIGPFALQGAIHAGEGKEEIVIFDVSMRIPGSPGTAYTPYSKYLYGKDLSFGKRVAMEIKDAADSKQLDKIVT